MTGKVFLITGTSAGFGAELVKVVLEKGDIAVATARDPSQLKFSGATEKNYLALALDVTDKASIETAFDETIARFGRVDVVVNNAGYGLAGIFESFTEDQIRRQMEVNFFGLVDVTRKAMRTMRELKTGGLIQQVTSIGGLNGSPTYSIYCASKFAVEGFTEALAAEVKSEWNIKFQLVEPGGFRTDWAGRSMTVAPNHPAYDNFDVPAKVKGRNGTQGGDPPKGARAMWELATMDDPPFRCVLGSEAYGIITKKLTTMTEQVAKFETFSKATDITEEA